jgi:hypothetical protein
LVMVKAFKNFLTFMAVVYFLIVIPYKAISARRGVVVFGEPAPAKTCPACLSDDLPVAASKCKYCGTDQPPGGTSSGDRLAEPNLGQSWASESGGAGYVEPANLYPRPRMVTMRVGRDGSSSTFERRRLMWTSRLLVSTV